MLGSMPEPHPREESPSPSGALDFDVGQFRAEVGDFEKVGYDWSTSRDESGKFKACLAEPLRQPVVDKILILQQLGGPPRFKLPWYDEPPPFGREVHCGMKAGDKLGPVTKKQPVTTW